MKMKTSSIILIFFLLFGCSNEKDSSPILIGSQFLSCDHFINLDGDKVNNLETPVNFKISPREALKIVKDKTGFDCHNKMGAQIYADERYYYFVRIGTGNTLNIPKALTSISIIIDGIAVTYWEMKYGGYVI